MRTKALSLVVLLGFAVIGFTDARASAVDEGYGTLRVGSEVSRVCESFEYSRECAVRRLGGAER